MATLGRRVEGFYLSDFASRIASTEARHALKWDIPLLEGYEYEFIANSSRIPVRIIFPVWTIRAGVSTGGMEARCHPDVRLQLFEPSEVLLSWPLRKVPIMQRGDSHDLARARGLKPTPESFTAVDHIQTLRRFLSVGKANADYLRNSGVPESRILLRPIASTTIVSSPPRPTAEHDAAVWRRELGMAADATVILFAGNSNPTSVRWI